ncbi:MAG: hypothetical protein KBC22_00125 [Candidatus Pacebacteria bacterium]|nr:hypothetical protein [Candidatus Paceibacterota bacterium]
MEKFPEDVKKHIEQDLESDRDSLADFLKAKGLESGIAEEIKSFEEYELGLEAAHSMASFVEEKILNGELSLINFHGHLGFKDAKFWGHYFAPMPGGFQVTVYLQGNISGDSMDTSGSRGPSIVCFVPLSQDLQKKFKEKVLSDVKKYYDEGSENEWVDMAADAVEVF